METTTTFLTGPDSSKDCHPQGRLCSWDFMKRVVCKFDRNTDWTKGQRTLSTTEAKIKNYWKICDYEVPLFPTADLDLWAHPFLFWDTGQLLLEQVGAKALSAAPEITSCCRTRMEGCYMADKCFHPDRGLWRPGLQVARTAVIFFMPWLFKPYMEPKRKAWSAVMSAQVFLEEPWNSGISLKAPH